MKPSGMNCFVGAEKRRMRKEERRREMSGEGGDGALWGGGGLGQELTGALRMQSLVYHRVLLSRLQ